MAIGHTTMGVQVLLCCSALTGGVMHTSLDLHLRLGRLLRPAQDLHLLLEVNVNVHKLGSIRHRQAMRYYV